MSAAVSHGPRVVAPIMHVSRASLLAVGSMTVLATYLREHGSPGSKPVGSAPGDTSESG
ncbi:DUF6766 family protein [Pseudonocardia sp. DLS-67]